MSQQASKAELEKDNEALRGEVRRLIEANQALQARLQGVSEELYNTQIMELNKRRELDVATAMVGEKTRELEALLGGSGEAAEAPAGAPASRGPEET